MNNIKYLALIVLLTGCSQQSTETAFEELMDSEWSKIVADNPVYASSMGDLRFNTEWSDNSIGKINEDLFAKLYPQDDPSVKFKFATNGPDDKLLLGAYEQIIEHLHTKFRDKKDKKFNFSKDRPKFWAEIVTCYNDILLSRFRLHPLEVNTMKRAFRIFETINHRGQPLAVWSLFRSLFQGRKWPGSYVEAISSICCLGGLAKVHKNKLWLRQRLLSYLGPACGKQHHDCCRRRHIPGIAVSPCRTPGWPAGIGPGRCMQHHGCCRHVHSSA